MSDADNGVYFAVFKADNNIAKNGNPPKSEINWATLKASLERRSDSQIKLVFELVEHMKHMNSVNQQHKEPARINGKCSGHNSAF